jgi:D-amino-acid dehydrogenase
MSDFDADVLVIGGGIIGVAVAAALKGQSVIVLDAGAPAFGTSSANAGHIVVSHATPFAAPGMVGQGIRSLLARDGAFALSPRLPLSGLTWLARFTAHCTARNAEALTPGMLSLLRNSVSGVRSLGIPTSSQPIWEVFAGNGSQKRATHEADHMRALGIDSALIDPELVSESEPLLISHNLSVVELREDFGVDPQLLWETLKVANEQATFLTNHTADAIDTTTDGVQVHVGATTLRARKLVIAAGAWTPIVTRLLGISLPIIAAKGYSITVPELENNVHHPMIFADEKFVVNPLGNSLRISSRFELTRANDRSIDPRQIRHMYAQAKTVVDLPDLPQSLESLAPWTGVRPASADGAPYIGPLPGMPHVVVASGHGMIGTSSAMGTADLVARYIRGGSITTAELALTPNR